MERRWAVREPPLHLIISSSSRLQEAFQLNRRLFSLRPWLALAIAVGVFPAPAPVAQTADAARYKTYDEMTSALRALAQSNANLVKLVDLGKSHEGRSVWAVELGS